MTDYDYIKDGTAIYEKSFAIIRAEADLSRFSEDEADVAVRMIHAAGESGRPLRRQWMRADSSASCRLSSASWKSRSIPTRFDSSRPCSARASASIARATESGSAGAWFISDRTP